MNKYKVTPANINGDYMWEVFELATKNVIDRFFFEEDAMRYAKRLEHGAGFDGWTPAFILQAVAVNEDLNRKFNKLFES